MPLAFLALPLLWARPAAAQPRPQPQQGAVLDRVVAVVDQEFILQSELDAQTDYARRQGQADDGTLRCGVFENMLAQKLLLVKAKLDSLEVSEEQVEAELDRRLEQVMRQAGGQEEMERLYRKSMVEIRVDLRPNVRDQMLAERQRNQIFRNMAATPREVSEFFDRIPADSLPYLPAEVELAQIVLKPQPSKATKDATRARLEGIRQQILKDEMTFAQMARAYSQDPGSARQDGSLGEFGRGMMVPAFEEMAYTMAEGQVSPVFESDFGFHILKVHKRLGDRVQASHILLIPEVGKEEIEAARARLAEIRGWILADSMSFEAAAAEFSDDKRTKDYGGAITDPRTGERRIPLDALDADLYFKVDRMAVGDLSEPLELRQRGERGTAWQLIRLSAKHPPHRATLAQDYQKFYSAAVQAKQAAELDRWFRTARTQVHVEIKDNSCAQALQNWK